MLEMGKAKFQSKQAHLSLNKFIRDILEEKLIIGLNPLLMQVYFSRRKRRYLELALPFCSSPAAVKPLSLSL